MPEGNDKRDLRTSNQTFFLHNDSELQALLVSCVAANICMNANRVRSTYIDCLAWKVLVKVSGPTVYAYCTYSVCTFIVFVPKTSVQGIE